VVCSRVSTSQIAIEAAHTNALGRRGLSQKSSDYSAIPLCPSHHRDNTDSYHRLGEQRFAREHGIDLPQLVGSLNHLFHRYIGSPPMRGGPHVDDCDASPNC
jgi:hypothetical protein